MTRNRHTPKPEPEPGPAHLTVPSEQFRTEIDDRIRIGEELDERPIGDVSAYEVKRSAYATWNDYNEELLKRRFTTSEVADEYSRWGVMSVPMYPTLADKIEDLQDDIQTKLRRLTSIRERIPLFPEAVTVREGANPSARRRAAETESVFIVHGRNEALKLAVHGFLRDVTDLDPVILHDQPNLGRTVIEKFEAVGGGAAFAVVLLTADDVGRSAGAAEDAEFERRARQNVVLELGFFVGSLGRSHVAVLYEPGVTKPSDIDGLVYIHYDDQGGWKLPLARELKAAGMTVDANALV